MAEQAALAGDVEHLQGSAMLAIRLDPEIEQRLQRLAERTGRSKTSHAREAIIEHLNDLEDIYLAEERLKQPGKTYSADEVKAEVGR